MAITAPLLVWVNAFDVSWDARNPVSGRFQPCRPDTNRPVQLQKQSSKKLEI